MDIRVGAMKPFSSILHATLEPIGGSHFSNQRARDRLITFPDLAGPSYDKDRCRIDLSSKVVPQSVGHNAIISSDYSVLSHSNRRSASYMDFKCLEQFLLYLLVLSSTSHKGWKRSASVKGVADSTLSLIDVTNTITPLGGFLDDFNQGSLQIMHPKKIKVFSISFDDNNMVDAAILELHIASKMGHLYVILEMDTKEIIMNHSNL
ncbi:hypothetical protein Pyn_28998 [Prunus yedoensis var. nudiflora]|uniref:Uncharacterized protein n=1 Tax=Prunus yedoensis var. nudiflora TaxID=2094558 RepID=A0A314Z601_PRUYE|nr:hypothetical protein Pyn_28998 [Prunus yedoensis var. nudiflora]